MLQLAADYEGPVEGTVVESNVDRGLGRVGNYFLAILGSLEGYTGPGISYQV